MTVAIIALALVCAYQQFEIQKLKAKTKHEKYEK